MIRRNLGTGLLAVATIGFSCLGGCERPIDTPPEMFGEAIDETRMDSKQPIRGGNTAVDETGDEPVSRSKRPPSVDVQVGADRGLDISIGDKSDPDRGAIDVEVGGDEGVRVDVSPKQGRQ